MTRTTPTTDALALVATLEHHLAELRSGCAGIAHATARSAQTTARARRLAGDARALLEEATAWRTTGGHTAPSDPHPPPAPMTHVTPAPATARARRMGSPDALAAALAALGPDPDALVASRAEQWREQLSALEDARQALLEDRPNWLAGSPRIQLVISVLSL